MIFVFILSVIFGLAVGSFINALVWRLREGKTLGGRSMCPHCKKTLTARELVPVFSFLWQKGKCRHCKKRMSMRYPLVEIATAVAFVIVTVMRHGELLPMVIDWGIVALLLSLFLFDLYYGLLPDFLTLPAIAFVVIERLIVGAGSTAVLPDMLWGAGVGVVFFGTQWIVSKGKWIGDGDIRLGALMGVLLGFPAMLLALLISYAIGSLVGIALVATRAKQWSSRIALGPFLIAGTVVVYYFEDQLLWWLGL